MNLVTLLPRQSTAGYSPPPALSIPLGGQLGQASCFCTWRDRLPISSLVCLFFIFLAVPTLYILLSIFCCPSFSQHVQPTSISCLVYSWLKFKHNEVLFFNLHKNFSSLVQLFISLLSKTSVVSKYCQDELALAYVSGRAIFPVALDQPKDLYPLMDTGMYVIIC